MLKIPVKCSDKKAEVEIKVETAAVKSPWYLQLSLVQWTFGGFFLLPELQILHFY